MFGDEIERIVLVDPLTGEQLDVVDELMILPASHYVTGDERMRPGNDVGAHLQHEDRKRQRGGQGSAQAHRPGLRRVARRHIRSGVSIARPRGITGLGRGPGERLGCRRTLEIGDCGGSRGEVRLCLDDTRYGPQRPLDAPGAGGAAHALDVQNG